MTTRPSSGMASLLRGQRSRMRTIIVAIWRPAKVWMRQDAQVPLLVIAKNWVFLCILHCCMAFGRLFVAFLVA